MSHTDDTNDEVVGIRDTSITKIMSGSFLDYSMSVIVSRAIPDVRDGLKPVHRRILYAMIELDMVPKKGYKKSARIVGDVIGKYHPHGDSAVYETMVRMGQEWSMRSQLVDMHGNNGSMDGDSAAAMRYTEAKLHKNAMEILRDYKDETVDYVDNYDGEEKEPVVLPARFPNLLVNGSEGIAVGMATKIPPHNLREVIGGTIALIDNPEITIEELMEYIQGPDFPTGATIMGRDGIINAYKTGKGSMTIRGEAEIIETKKETKIIIKEIPFQVNKAALIKQIQNIQDEHDKYIAMQKKEKGPIEEKGLDFAVRKGVKDGTDRNTKNNQVHIEIVLKKGIDPEIVLNHLYAKTSLQTTFSMNNLSLVPKQLRDGRKILEPKILNLKETLVEYVKHLREVTRRKAEYDLRETRKKAHLSIGLMKALDKMDEVVEIIKASSNRADAVSRLIDFLEVDKIQAEYILDKRLQTLATFEQDTLRAEYKKYEDQILYLEELLADEFKMTEFIKADLLDVANRLGDERRTHISDVVEETNSEDLIPNKEAVVTITQNGFIKRTDAKAYRTQKRKGIGVNGMTMYDDDFLRHLHLAKSKDTLLFFTNEGRVYQKKVYQIPEAKADAKGKNIRFLLDLNETEQVQAVYSIREFSDEQFLLFVTKNGRLVKSRLSDFANIRRNGIAALDLKDNDRLVGATLTNGNRNITLITKYGMSITLEDSEENIKPVKRPASGVGGIALSKKDEIISFVIHEENADLFIATNEGFGKRTPLSEYRVQNRLGKGVLTYKLTEKNGEVIGACVVQDLDTLMLMTKNGTLMKLLVDEISQISRNTQGTRIINLRDGDELRLVTRIPDEDETEEINENENKNIQ